MIKWSFIKEYVILAETLSFTKAAELSYITQPALSRHIAILEEEFDCRLFERSTREVKLTPSGEVVYEAFRSILNLYETARWQAKSLAVNPIENIIINSPYYWTGDYTEPLINRFVEDYPSCNVSVNSCQPIDGLMGLENGECDIFISMEMKDISTLISGVPFAKEELHVFMDNEHCYTQKKVISLNDFNNQPYIYMKGFDRWKREYLQGMDQKLIFPSIVECCEQIDIIGLTLKQTKGLCILPYSVKYMNRSYLINKPFAEAQFVDMWVYYRIDNHNPMIEKFLKANNLLSYQK
ncbi:DNA-binding transcriptional regulator, LysR family [Acetoanaerobium noterae]|uniref:DNA-binding transcriptional regulator, LysR family n=1 Tax=Acetoanaerobium noterae TaxID=745369 RepID=A0A1T4ZQE7_9FIRM|nr:LysR family transcriptional regulator [Acetoanaerobium noterae]SKB24777.1 DNA-binding transcriptional regulator, LysR family [Acetoanaerobium noterae]